MRCAILLHSATGNTRLATRFAARHLEAAGVTTTVHDVGRGESPPPLDEVELLGVACPTMYFRPTLVMERAVVRLPVPAKRKAAFLLATAGGEPGAHFEIVDAQLARKDYVVVGAHLLAFPESWPPHRAAVAGLRLAGPAAEALARVLPSSRHALATCWPDVGVPDAASRRALEAFLDGLPSQVERLDSGVARRRRVPRATIPGTRAAGLLLDQSRIRKAAGIEVVPARCSRCGTCVTVCPSGAMTRADDESLPTVGSSCTGCWACYNHCPDGAVRGKGAADGVGRYRGPSPEVRSLFRG